MRYFARREVSKILTFLSVVNSGEVANGEELFAGKVRAFKPSAMESFPLPAKVIQQALDLGASEIVLSVDPVEEA